MEEPPKTKAVAGYGEVVEMPLEEQVQPLSGRGDGIVHSFAQFHLQRLKLRHHPFLDRLAPDDKSPGLGSRAEMREAEEVESLRLPLPSLFALRGREAAEADQPGLGWMQRQFELAQALVQILQERPGLVLMLKAGDESSSGEESHPSALTEPDVTLSRHPAPTLQPPAAHRVATGRTSSDPAVRCAPASALPHAPGA